MIRCLSTLTAYVGYLQQDVTNGLGHEALSGAHVAVGAGWVVGEVVVRGGRCGAEVAELQQRWQPLQAVDAQHVQLGDVYLAVSRGQRGYRGLDGVGVLGLVQPV